MSTLAYRVSESEALLKPPPSFMSHLGDAHDCVHIFCTLVLLIGVGSTCKCSTNLTK